MKDTQTETMMRNCLEPHYHIGQYVDMAMRELSVLNQYINRFVIDDLFKNSILFQSDVVKTLMEKINYNRNKLNEGLVAVDDYLYKRRSSSNE